MKQLRLLLLLLCLLLATASQASTISGTVKDAKTSQPVPGLVIYVTDSASSFLVTVITNASGQYTATLPTSTPIGRKIIAGVNACGVAVTASQYYTGSNITGANLNVCSGSALYNLQGNVVFNGSPNNGQARLYLIRKAYDSVLTDTTYAVVDSFATSLTGGSFTRTYNALPGATLLLKAALLPNHPQYKKYLPTYYSSALTWSGAKQLTATNLIAADTIVVSMTPAVDTPGKGSIGGAVVMGAGKSTANVGDPLPGRILILTRSNNVAVRFAYSDASGYYRFDSLAYGTYKIFGDALGKSNPALTLTITAARPSYSDILFTENSKQFYGRIGGVGVAAASIIEHVQPYPNPVGDDLNFSGTDAIAGGKTVTICDIQGSVIIRQAFAAGEMIRLSTRTLSGGMYLVTLRTEGGIMNFKIVK